MADTFDPEAHDPRHIETLLAVMKALRTPGTGCAWDLDQSFDTIAPYTIEEAYEVADAIENNDMPGLCDELGDLLLQVVFHAQMATEAGEFDFSDVVKAINDKMVRRHPHVFGDEKARSASLAKGFWEDMKAREKRTLGRENNGILEDVATALPALTRAQKLQRKASRVGFDWQQKEDVFETLQEEFQELQTASRAENQKQVEEEFGDVLFSAVNLARHLDVEPEAALRAANAKFKRRFGYIEEQLRIQGKSPEDASLAEMDALWERAKKKEKPEKP